MDVREALLRNRSRRRFYQDYIIPENDLMTIADAARLSPSGRNIQALKFLISSNQHLNSRIFPTLAWAGYLTGWPGPEEGERPYAYIIQLLDKSITPNIMSEDCGMALGYGGCIIAAVRRKELHAVLELDDRFSVMNVIALGKPKETVVLEDMRDGDYKYWRDADETHHVPKRSLQELVIRIK